MWRRTSLGVITSLALVLAACGDGGASVAPTGGDASAAPSEGTDMADDQTLIQAAKKAHRRMEVVQTMRKLRRSREGGWPG